MASPGWGAPEFVASEEAEAGGQPVVTVTPPHLASCILGLLHLIGRLRLMEVMCSIVIIVCEADLYILMLLVR